MYAAAGGASLASRQARMRQKQQKKNQQLQAKLHPPKAPGIVGVELGASTPTRQSRQFHQLPTNYLRAPQAHGRKLSASYTAQSKLLLPIEEGDTQSVLHMRGHSHGQIHPMLHSHAHGQQPHQQQQQHHAIQGSYYQHFAAAAAAAAHGRVSPKLMHRHSGSSAASFHQLNFPKSATATLPLVSQMDATPPATPSGAAVVKPTASFEQEQPVGISIPKHDAIIVTPATPMASPGHVAKLRETDEVTAAVAEKQPLTAPEDDDDEPMQPPTGPLERKCSVYRMRRSDADEYGDDSSNVKRQLRELQFSTQQQQYEPLVIDEPQLIFKGLPNGRKWQPCAYCEEGICVCEHIECAQGRAAWLERGRRCSVQEREQQQAACHRRWVKRNRIQDASLGGSSDDEDFLGVLRGPSTFANAFLYVGLGTVALGLVIAFVGTGEKGFKTVELRLIGPSLIVLGLICCILRILFCICPSHCISSNKKIRKKNGNKVDADHTTSLLRAESKRVSIARGPQPRYLMTHKHGNNKMLNEGMEALRQLATTSLFMQNEQKPSMNRIVPIIKEPDHPIEASLEMKKLDTELSIYEIVNDTTLGDETYNLKKEITTKGKTITNVDTKTETSTPTAVKQKSTHRTKTTTATTESLPLTKPATTTTKTKPEHLEDTKTKSKTKITTTTSSTPTSDPANKLILQPVREEPPSTSAVEDTEIQMETSLSVISMTKEMNDEIFAPTLMTSSKTNDVTSMDTDTTIATNKTLQPPPPNSASTGAISRIPCSTTVTSYSLYDMPPSTPHTYSSTMRGDPLIRGPLGMPLSQLTASKSTTAMTGIKSSTAAISLLPVPAPNLSTTNETVCMPGQVIEPMEAPIATSTRNSLTARLSSPKGFMFSSPGRLSASNRIASGTAPALSAITQTPYKTSTIFQLPTSSLSTTLSSTLASIGHSNSLTISNSINTNTTTTSKETSTPLAPPLPHTYSKLEPELLLSPAKLGQ